MYFSLRILNTFYDFQKSNIVRKSACEISQKIIQQLKKIIYMKWCKIIFQDRLIFFHNSISAKISEIGQLTFFTVP
jgi:hypothetical protein